MVHAHILTLAIAPTSLTKFREKKRNRIQVPRIPPCYPELADVAFILYHVGDKGGVQACSQHPLFAWLVLPCSAHPTNARARARNAPPQPPRMPLLGHKLAGWHP